ncbi:MAG: hypothetical protein IPN47_27935 [Gemmatimonadetes bacterium]|nr:hypothetical protein [Gemmatimonadota bacterium]
MLLNATNCYAIPANCNDGGVDPIIVHETTHTYQFLSNRELRNGQSPFGQSWSLEGSAALHELLTALERHSIAWNANTQFEAFAGNDPRRQTAIFANGNVGLFTLGYRGVGSVLPLSGAALGDGTRDDLDRCAPRGADRAIERLVWHRFPGARRTVRDWCRGCAHALRTIVASGRCPARMDDGAGCR